MFDNRMSEDERQAMFDAAAFAEASMRATSPCT